MILRRRLHATDDELSALLDGRLSPGRRERVAGHLERCVVCTQALAGLRAVQASLRALPRAAASRSFALREADARPAPRSGTASARMMPLLSSVTAMTIIAFFAVVTVDIAASQSSSNKPNTPAALEKAGAPAAGDAARPANPGAFSAADQAATMTEQDLERNTEFKGLSPSGVPPQATPQLVESPTRGGGNDDIKLRIAEAALAAVALLSGGSTVFALRRRRQ